MNLTFWYGVAAGYALLFAGLIALAKGAEYQALIFLGGGLLVFIVNIFAVVAAFVRSTGR